LQIFVFKENRYNLLEMKLEDLWAVDKRIFWRMSFWWFLIMELILRIKLGVIFWLCFGWFLVLNWQAKVFWGKSLGKNQPEVVLKSAGFFLR